MLRLFNPPRLKASESILKFWERNKGTYPDLFRVAVVILSVPGTQVTVERLFSQLKFILNYLRNSLDADIIDDILLLKANFNNITMFN